MARLPTVGGDTSAWGTVLNAYLGVAHNSDGTLKNRLVNLADFCAIDGSTDDSVGFTTAYALASSLHTGLWHPGGTLIKGNDTLLSNVPIVGAGPGISTIKLKAAANVDLFSANTGSINLSASFGGGSSTGVNSFSIRNITLDGNKANQSSGTSYPLRFYGYSWFLENVRIINGYSGGMLNDWNPSSQPEHYIEPRLNNVFVTDCNGVGVRSNAGDQQWINVTIGVTGSHNLHLGPLAGAPNFTNVHCWGAQTGNSSVGMLIESSYGLFANCEAEGSDTCQVVMLGTNMIWSGGRVFSAGVGTPSGFQLGQQAGNTPYAGQIYQSAGVTTSKLAYYNRIDTGIDDCTGTNGAIWYANEQQNIIKARVSQTAGSAYSSNGPASTTTHDLNVFGLSFDGSGGAGGQTRFQNHSYHGFSVCKDDGTEYLCVSTQEGIVKILNGAQLIFYSDYGATSTMQIQNGTFGLGVSATAVAIANGATVTTHNTGVSRVAPTGNVTGIVLQTGDFSGQLCEVVNESAFTVTFDVSGTSKVADGTSAAIAAKRKMSFTWDSSTSLWYHS